jgi:hypothetical protein
LPTAHFDRNATTPVTDLVHWIELHQPDNGGSKTMSTKNPHQKWQI